MSCHHSFIWHNPAAKKSNERIWFQQWLTEGYSIRQLSLQSGHSRSKLSRIITDHLASEPPQLYDDYSAFRYLILDGTFLHRPVSIVEVMDAETNTVISGQYKVKESSSLQLTAFFHPLIHRGLQPVSCTVDGNPHVIRTLRRLWPDTRIQRCLVHIQRQGLSWCRVNPKTTYARHLRKLFLQVTRITTRQERDHFMEAVIDWEKHYGKMIDHRTETGWVFSDIKRARSMLLKALPDMFHYLDDPAIPCSTNSLEGYFSRLKSRYRQHRGLSPKKLNHYFAWYIFLNPR